MLFILTGTNCIRLAGMTFSYVEYYCSILSIYFDNMNSFFKTYIIFGDVVYLL